MAAGPLDRRREWSRAALTEDTDPNADWAPWFDFLAEV
jgi:hypothetical protein